jgi:hypothetical protein
MSALGNSTIQPLFQSRLQEDCLRPMLAAAIADDLARRRRTSNVPPVPPLQPVPSPPRPGNPSPAVPTSTPDRSKPRPRRYTPYGPVLIKPSQPLTDQISAIQAHHHQIASHDYFLTAPEYRGTAKRAKEPTGMWGFAREDVQRYPVLRKRNFFCIQHHQATGTSLPLPSIPTPLASCKPLTEFYDVLLDVN